MKELLYVFFKGEGDLPGDTGLWSPIADITAQEGCIFSPRLHIAKKGGQEE